jgi:hypothetical protein
MKEDTHLQYKLNVKGLYGRNRSVKFQSILLTNIPISDQLIDYSSVLNLMEDKLIEIKFKGDRISLIEQPVCIDGGSTSFMICTDKLIFTEDRK